jgi:hypothetical protein
VQLVALGHEFAGRGLDYFTDFRRQNPLSPFTL